MPYRKPYKTYPTNKSRFAKRWYIDASIPKSVPIVGGTSLRAGSGNLAKRNLNAVIKSAISNSSILKHKVIDSGSNFQAKHNTILTFNPLGNIPTGTGENSRVSTDIHVKQIRVNFRFTNVLTLTHPQRGSSVKVRLMWVRRDLGVLASNDTFGSGLGAGTLFPDGMTNTMLSPLDRDKVTVLSDTIVDIPAAYTYWHTLDAVPTSSINSKYITFDCPLKEFQFRYQLQNSGYSAINKNVYLIMVPFLEGATTGSTDILQCQFTSVVDFTDNR